MGLDVRCIGIKKMDHAPDFSVETLAKYSISVSLMIIILFLKRTPSKEASGAL